MEKLDNITHGSIPQTLPGFLMEIYRLWYLRRGATMQGPFPEALVCRFIVLGRVSQQDEVSQDGCHWHPVETVPELAEGVRKLLGMGKKTDTEWSEERAKAVLRWLDDRKSPDPRAHAAGQQSRPVHEQRSGLDRRQGSESVEQVAYREWRGEFEGWLRQQRQRYGYALASIAAVVLGVILLAVFKEPVNPIPVGLTLHATHCEAEPARGVNWSGCDKRQALLVGADLRGAELVGTQLQEANLSQADLRGANLSQARLEGAKLDRARFEGAIWLNGRRCAEGSVGRCREDE